jgi:hypothetical protein
MRNTATKTVLRQVIHQLSKNQLALIHRPGLHIMAKAKTSDK